MRTIWPRPKSDATTSRPRGLTQRRALILLSVALLLILIGNARWLQLDRSSPAWDAARYLVNSVEAFDFVRAPSLAHLRDLYFVRNTVRPSLGMVLPTLPFYLLLGISEDTATLWTQWLFLAVIVFSVYGIGKRLFGVGVGLLAALLAALNPELIRLSRIYWPELGVVATASLGVYWLLRSEFLRHRAPVLLAGIVLGLGMMQRPLFPLIFLAGPLAYVFIGALLTERQAGETLTTRLTRRFLPGLGLFLLPVLLIDLPFYARYGGQMLDYITGFQEAGSFAPVENSASLQSLFWYAANLYASVSWPLHLLFLASLIGFIFLLVRRQLPAAAGILLAWVVVPYLALSLTASKGFSYIAALYPALILILAATLWRVTRPSRGLQWAAGALLLGLAVLSWWQISWARPLPASLANRLGLTASAPVLESWPNAAIIATIHPLAPADKITAVGVVSAVPELAEPPMAYYARIAAPTLTVLRWSDPVPTLLDADFVVVKTGRVAEDPPRTLEDRNATLVSKVLQQPTSTFYTTHQQIGRFGLPDGSQALIYQRTGGAPQAAEVTAIGDELAAAGGTVQNAGVAGDLNRAALQNQVRLGKQLFDEKRYEEALPVFQQVVDADPKIADAQQGLGRTLFALGNCDSAAEHQALATQLLPINGTYTVLGDILFECKRLEEASAAYVKGIELDPQEVRTHFVLAQVYMAQGRTQDAIREFNTTMELDKTGEFTPRVQNFLQQLQP